MNQQIESGSYRIFDQNEMYSSILDKNKVAYKIADTVLQISDIVIDFASIERVPRYCRFKRENDAEHSFMLALVGIEVASQFYPGLDSGLIGKFALVHDLIERKTGDVPTFDLTDEQMEQKHANDRFALPEVLKDLPPHIGDLLMLYEEQEIAEAQFTKHTDKLLPNAVNIKGAGIKVMLEDYGVSAKHQFLDKNDEIETRFKSIFKDQSHEPLHAAHRIIAEQFASYLPQR